MSPSAAALNPWERFSLWTLRAAVVSIPLLFLSPNASLLLTKVSLLTIFTALGLFAWRTAALIRGETFLAWPRPLSPLLLWVIVLTACSFLALSPRESFLGQWDELRGLFSVLILSFFLFWVIQNCVIESRVRRLLLLYISTGVITSMMVFIRHFLSGPGQQSFPEPALFLGDSASFGVYLAMLMPLVLSAIQLQGTLLRRLLLFLVLLLFWGGILVTGSRCGAAAACAGIGLWAVIVKEKEAEHSLNWLYIFLALAVILWAAIDWQFHQKFGQTLWQSSLQDVFQTGSALWQTKFQMWKLAGKIFKIFPLWGAGLSCFDRALLPVFSQEMAAFSVLPRHASSGILTLLAECGALGFLAGLLVLLAIIREFFRVKRELLTLTPLLTFKGLTASLGAFVAGSFLTVPSFPLLVMCASFLGVFLSFDIVYLGKSVKKRVLSANLAVRFVELGVNALLVIMVVFVLAVAWSGDRALAKGLSQADKSPQEAIVTLNSAVQKGPPWFVYPLVLGDVAAQTNEIKRAEEAYALALARAPHDVRIYLKLASVQLKAQKTSKALETINRLKTLDPANPAVQEVLKLLQTQAAPPLLSVPETRRKKR